MKLTITLFVVPVLLGLGACAWQWYALHRVYPDGHMPYGHFQRASAQFERQTIIQYPSIATATTFIIYSFVGPIVWFRSGARWRILLLLLWVFLAYLPFGVYNFVLAAQGDASIFV